MQAITVKSIVASFNTYLKAGATFGGLMQQAAQANLPVTELLPALADVLAKHYGAYVRYTNRGTVGFYSDQECKTRHDAARKCWSHNVAPWFKSTDNKPKTRKQTDKVQDTATRLQKNLTKTEIKRLIKLLSQ